MSWMRRALAALVLGTIVNVACAEGQRNQCRAAVRRQFPAADGDGARQARREARQGRGARRHQGQLGQRRGAERDERRRHQRRDAVHRRRRAIADHALGQDQGQRAGQGHVGDDDVSAVPQRAQSEHQVDQGLHRQGQDRGPVGQGVDAGDHAADGGGEAVSATRITRSSIRGPSACRIPMRCSRSRTTSAGSTRTSRRRRFTSRK